MSLTFEKTRPQTSWLLCRLCPQTFSSGHILLPVDPNEKVTGEGVAEVVAAHPLYRPRSRKAVIAHGIGVGDKVLFRGFLRYAQGVGELYGAGHPGDVFLLHVDDVLALVEGAGTLGKDNEFRF